MPRQAISLAEFQEEIERQWNDNVSIPEIWNWLRTQGVQINQRTLERRLQEWGLERRTSGRNQAILEHVRYHFFRGFRDISILKDLESRGYSISGRTLQELRLRHGMKRRFRSPEERDAVLELAKEFLLRDHQQSSTISALGRGYLYSYVRLRAGILINRHELYKFYGETWPEYVARRQKVSFRHRTDFKVPGPNFLWSLDGYEKLKNFGFQIYACIDAYSRLIIWIYVGRSATTALSVLKQYLRTVSQAGVRPYFTRSDHGKETPLFAGAHATLAETAQTEISYIHEDGSVRIHRQGDNISSCHIWGPSTSNIKIERWWRSLREGASDRWIAFASELIDNGLFIPDNKVHLIAVYAIYGPMIREELATFVELWNSHRIRTQPNRPHVISGVPLEIYHHSNASEWGIPIPDNSEASEVLRTMLEPLQDIEIDEFMTHETTQWCNQQLESMGFDKLLRTTEDHKRPHLEAYLGLVQRIQEHDDSQELPFLELTPIPTGGTEKYLDILYRNYLQRESVRGDNIPQEAVFGVQVREQEESEI